MTHKPVVTAIYGTQRKRTFSIIYRTLRRVTRCDSLTNQELFVSGVTTRASIFTINRLLLSMFKVEMCIADLLFNLMNFCIICYPITGGAVSVCVYITLYWVLNAPSMMKDGINFVMLALG